MATSLPPGDLATIIVPCFNELPHTRLCIRALTRHTRPPFEVVVVDNGSTDGTRDYLAGLADVAPFSVRAIVNSENRGFPAAVNQGIEAARGTLVVLLNNDAVVTSGWLDQLAALADSDASIAMTGPMSNYASPPQLVPDVPYGDLDEMDRFAEDWRAERLGTWFDVEKLSGFCLLIKRSVLDTIGGLDERFGIGFFDDDDLSFRTRRAGYRLCVAHDLFVHHYGSRTFAGSGVNTEALLRENQARFAAKWGLSGTIGASVPLVPWTARPAPRGPRGTS